MKMGQCCIRAREAKKIGEIFVFFHVLSKDFGEKIARIQQEIYSKKYLNNFHYYEFLVHCKAGEANTHLKTAVYEAGPGQCSCVVWESIRTEFTNPQIC
jgi:hypothetical protein